MSEKQSNRKSLVTKDMVKMVQECIDTIKKIEQFNPKKSHTFSIGSIDVMKPVNEKSWLKLATECDKEYLKMWKSDVGGVLLQELRQEEPLLFLIHMDKFDVLAKRIRESEVKDAVTNGTMHFLIGDASYTIIKVMKKGCPTTTKDYNDYEIEREEEIESARIDIQEDQKEPSEDPQQYQLF